MTPFYSRSRIVSSHIGTPFLRRIYQSRFSFLECLSHQVSIKVNFLYLIIKEI